MKPLAPRTRERLWTLAYAGFYAFLFVLVVVVAALAIVSGGSK